MAPDKCATPSMTAVLPSIATLAPKRFISCTCIKRFSKIVSVTLELPLAIVFNAINWACMSVGKAGYSEVLKLTGLGLWAILARMVSEPISISKPASRNLAITASRVCGRHFFIVISPPVAATAHKKVPVSMRSAIISYSAPCNASTPIIVR